MVFAELIVFFSDSIGGIFNALRNTYIDGISLLMIFIAFMIFEEIVSFIFRMIRRRDEANEKQPSLSSSSSDTDQYDGAF